MAVTTERRGEVLVIRMDRPARRNAVDATMTAGLDAALNALDDDPDLRVGVLTGTSQVFSAGTDLVDGAGTATARGGEYGVARRRRRTPLVAAVEGPALGGGFELVNVLSEPGDALRDALALADRICAGSPAAVSATLEAVDASFAQADADGRRATESAWAQATASVDSTEGVDAFLARRAPRWSRS